MKSFDFMLKAFVLALTFCLVSKFIDQNNYMSNRSSIVSPISIDDSYILKKIKRNKERARIAAIANCKNKKDCLKIAEAMYFEARGESDIGIISVGQVIFRRMKTEGFPNTIYGVITQKSKNGTCHFSYICDIERGLIVKEFKEKGRYEKSLEFAYGVLNNKYKKYVGNADHYYNPDKVEEEPYWAKNMIKIGKIGHHLYLSSK